jgi:hypothetical protein
VRSGAVPRTAYRDVGGMEPEADGASRQLWVSVRRLPSELFPVSVGP